LSVVGESVNVTLRCLIRQLCALTYTFHRCQGPSISFMTVAVAWVKYTVLHQKYEKVYGHRLEN